MVIEVPIRNRKWTAREIQEYLADLGRRGAFGPFWHEGQPWGAEVQPYMIALGERGAFGPDWVAPPTREDIASRYPAPVVVKPPKREPIPVIELFTKNPAPRKPKPPDVSLWDITPEQEAAFNESAARALPLGLDNGVAELRWMFLCEEARFQGNLARIAAMRARRNLSNFDLGQFEEDRAIHVVGWNRMGHLAAERVRKERLAEIDD